MRVTNQMISDRVAFNLTRSLDRFMRLQSMMSSGRRIEKPSDDPIGTHKDLGYRHILSGIGQFRSNISSALSLLSRYDNILGNINDSLSTANELAISLANDTYDDVARAAAAEEAKSLFEQIIALGNSRLEGRYIFSGFRTGTQSFRLGTHGVEYMGDRGDIRVEIESATRTGINLIGSDILLGRFSVIGEESDWLTGVDSTTALSDLNLGDGVDLAPGTFVVRDNNLDIDISIDISAATTLGDLIAQVNGQLAAGGINNLTVSLGDEGNNLKWEAVDNGLISRETSLSNLNSGRGVDLSEGRILIHDSSDSINFEVDLTGAASIGDAIDTINAALIAAGVTGVTADINAAGTGIDIVDANGLPFGLIVDEVSDSSTTAADLGLQGNIDPVLSGTDLNPQPDFSVTETAAGETTGADLGLLGDFFYGLAGTSLQPRLADTTLLANLNNGLGYDLGRVTIALGVDSVTLDLGDPTFTTVGDIIDAINNCGLEITAAVNEAHTGIQITTTADNKTLIIDEADNSRTAHNLGLFGSPDILGSMMLLIDALEHDDREILEQLVGNFEKGMKHVLSSRAAVGSKVIRLETTDSRLVDLNYNFTKLLSEVEDADLTRLVTDLASQENNYQAALVASAKIIQPTLLDFLR